jgi:toxin ParE1/3/4
VKHVLRQAAKDDILRQFRYYLLQDALDTATRFLDAVDQSIQAICALPHAGAPRLLRNPTLLGLRFRPVTEFDDILIFYLVQPESLRIIPVLHGKRDINKILEREPIDEVTH